MASFLLKKRKSTISAKGTTYTWVPLTDWMPAISVKKYEAILQVENSTTGDLLRAYAGYQMATTRTSEPGTWAGSGTLQSGNGRTSSGVVTISGADSAFWVRFGVSVSSSTANYAQGEVSLTVSGTDR